jgi:hypothetical protein
MRTQVFANLSRELDPPAIEFGAAIAHRAVARSVTSEQLVEGNAQVFWNEAAGEQLLTCQADLNGLPELLARCSEFVIHRPPVTEYIPLRSLDSTLGQELIRIRNTEHNASSFRIVHLLRKRARLFRASAPMFGIINYPGHRNSPISRRAGSRHPVATPLDPGCLA